MLLPDQLPQYVPHPTRDIPGMRFCVSGVRFPAGRASSPMPGLMMPPPRRLPNIVLIITDDAIDALADTAVTLNGSIENIGARRLQTVMERLLEDISFEAEEHEGETVTIDAAYVRERLDDLARDTDLSKYIL